MIVQFQMMILKKNWFQNDRPLLLLNQPSEMVQREIKDKLLVPIILFVMTILRVSQYV